MKSKAGDKGKFYTGVSILVGTTIGAGVLGIPYVAAQAGFLLALGYIIVLGMIVLFVNLCLGEVVLRTKKDHQIAGYANRYFGKQGRFLTEVAMVFGVYSALVAYMLGIGESLSFLFFNHTGHVVYFGIATGLAMSWFLWQGLSGLKRFEKFGVSLVVFLFILIFLVFSKDINFSNLAYLNLGNIFLPFGVVLFALLSFHAVPEINLTLKGKKGMMKKILITGSLLAIIIYSLFALVVSGSLGLQTPEVATLALGSLFVCLGILTMFTSYLALGNAIEENFRIDGRMTRFKAWLLSAIVPIFVFVAIKIIAFEFFSFTKVLSIGGVISGGLIAVVSLLMVKKAKIHGDRKPEYTMSVSWLAIALLSLIFLLGVIVGIFPNILQ